MRRILILADDLSGAADCGIACMRDGGAVVALGETASDLHAEVLSIDTNTRCMESIDAAIEMERLVRKYAHDEETLLYKKIDSTLRGHIAHELAAMLQGYRSLHGSEVVAVMAPAFPASGRTTAKGHQLVHGQPLHERDIWKHQGMAGRSHIPEMLEAAGLRSALVPLDVVRSSRTTLANAMKVAACDTDVLVCDAETEADLQAITHAATELGRKVIWVGSAGLAYHLPELAGLPTSAAMKLVRPVLSGPILYVIGSLSQISREQVSMLTASSKTLRITVPPEVLLGGDRSPSWQEWEGKLIQAIASHQDVVFGPGFDVHVSIADRQRLTTALASMTALIRDKVGALVATGGETARAILQHWGVTALRLQGEIERGVPVSMTESWVRELPVITKAGDFGGPETLLHCRRFLHGIDREQEEIGQ